MLVEDVTVRGGRTTVDCGGGGIVSIGCPSYTVASVLSAGMPSSCRNLSLTRRAGAVTTDADVEATFSAVRQAQTPKTSRIVNASTRIIVRMYITAGQWRNFSPR